MNELPSKMFNGVIGELVAQLSLIEHNVQAAPPLRDSGNDLIACKGSVILALQVKGKLSYRFSKRDVPEKYHGVVFIRFTGRDGRIDLRKGFYVYLLTRRELLDTASLSERGLEPFLLTPKRIKEVFRRENMVAFEHRLTSEGRRLAALAKRLRRPEAPPGAPAFLDSL